MKLIAFTGPLGSGKNTAAENLGASLDATVALLAFATPLYEGLSSIMGLCPIADSLEYLCEDREFKETPNARLRGLSPRQGLQRLGDWVRENLGQDYLIRAVEQRIAEIEDSQFRTDLFAITDLRTESEAAWVRQHNGLVIHMIRGDLDISPSRTHSTEQRVAFHESDAALFNNGSPDELRISAANLVLHWLGLPKVAA